MSRSIPNLLGLFLKLVVLTENLESLGSPKTPCSESAARRSANDGPCIELRRLLALDANEDELFTASFRADDATEDATGDPGGIKPLFFSDADMGRSGGALVVVVSTGDGHRAGEDAVVVVEDDFCAITDLFAELEVDFNGELNKFVFDVGLGTNGEEEELKLSRCCCSPPLLFGT